MYVLLALSSSKVLEKVASFSSIIEMIGFDAKSNNNYYEFVSSISFNLSISFNFVKILNTSNYSFILSLLHKYIFLHCLIIK